MFLCLVVECGSKRGRDKFLYVTRVPSVFSNQGEEPQKLSEDGKTCCILTISCDNLSEEVS